MDKVKVFKEYGLKDNDLDIIRNADCDRKDAYNATVDKITEIAFATDKKGSKGTKKQRKENHMEVDNSTVTNFE